MARAGFLRDVDGVAFFRCSECGSLFADPDFLRQVDTGGIANYGDTYWSEECASAQERSYGGSIARAAEIIRLSRIPLRRFLDIGCGPGYLLDSLSTLLPGIADMFHGVELLPPPEGRRSRHPNYRIGTIEDLDGLFDGGVCIEVIEHLTPMILGILIGQLAARSTPGALYFFNSAQPSFVEASDPAYLDPKRRGHIVSWSIAGIRRIFEPAGFNVIPLPGRDWAFLAEYGPPRTLSADDLMSWLWTPVTENMALLRDQEFGALFTTIGIESSRCYLESAIADARLGRMPEVERRLHAAARSLAPRVPWLKRLRARTI